MILWFQRLLTCIKPTEPSMSLLQGAGLRNMLWGKVFAFDPSRIGFKGGREREDFTKDLP